MGDIEEGQDSEERTHSNNGPRAIDMRHTSPAAPQPPETSSTFPILPSPDAAAQSAAAASLTLPIESPRNDPEDKPADILGLTERKGQDIKEPAETAINGQPPTLHSASEVQVPEEKMLFADLTKTSSAAHRRRAMATTSAFTDYEADLTNKDRAKAKEAVKKYLGERVQSNWEFEWPRTEISRPSTREDIEEENWKERDEWESNDSVGEEEDEVSTPETSLNPGHSPFRFENPDNVGETVRKVKSDRKRRRRKRLGDEMQWNDGVRCFVHRRNAWTSARRTPVPKSLLDPLYTPTPPPKVLVGSDDDSYDMDQIPIAPPLLPPENPIRAGIGPAAYGNIYDKVVCQSQTPSVPINLKDVVKSCVQGWQRDGEWPPRERPVEPMMARKKSGGIRKSLQRVFGVGKREVDI